MLKEENAELVIDGKRPKTITCSTILRYVRALVNSDGTKVERLYRLMNGRVEALEFIARASDSYIGIPLKNLHIRKKSNS